VGSPAEFRIGELDVRIDNKAECDTELLDATIYLPHGTMYPPRLSRLFELQFHPVSKSSLSISCDKLPLKVGTRVRVAGQTAGPLQPFFATQITAYDVKIRLSFARGQYGKGAALLEEQAHLSQINKGLAGKVWVDGYPFTLTPETELLSAPAGTEISYRASTFLEDPHWAAVMPKASPPAFVASLFAPNSWATYQIDESAGDHGIVHLANRERISTTRPARLEQIRVWRNRSGQKEREFDSKFTPIIHPPDYARHIPGSVAFGDQPASKSLEILPNRLIQEFISKLGWSLVPGYQRRLAANDPTKINFHFYAVHAAKPRSDDEMSRADSMVLAWHKNLNRGIVALPDGTILVPDYMAARVGNEAQMATLLSCAIQSVLQKQAYITRRSRPWDNPEDANPGGFGYPIHGFVFYLLRNEQDLRLGIRQMYLAGYDIRESPFAWAVVGGRRATNPSSPDNKTAGVIPWYVEYTFDYINRYYADVDYGRLKRGVEEYAHFLNELHRASPHAF